MDFLKTAIKIFTGGKSNTPSGKINGIDIYAALRNAVIVGLIVGGIASLESLDAKDWGLVDTLVASAVSGGIELLRKLLKDYTAE